MATHSGMDGALALILLDQVMMMRFLRLLLDGAAWGGVFRGGQSLPCRVPGGGRFVVPVILIGFLAGVFSDAVAQSGDELVSPTNITQTQGDTDTTYFSLSNLINGSGLSATPTLSNLSSVTHAYSGDNASSNCWKTTSVDEGRGEKNYFDEGEPNPQFVLTLDRQYSISELVGWGCFDEPQDNVSDATDCTVEFSTDGGSTFGSNTETVSSQKVVSDLRGFKRFPERLPFGNGRSHLANALRVTITENAEGRGVSGEGGDRVSLGEIRFVGNIPRPSGCRP